MNVNAVCAAFMSGLLMWGTNAIAQVDPNAPWPMFGHDRRHSGTSPLEGPSAPGIIWSYDTGDDVVSSAAVADDGTVYIGSGGWWEEPHGTSLFSFTHHGALRWSYYGAARGVESSPALGVDGRIYVGTVGDASEGALLCLSSTGALHWSFTMGNVPQSPVPAHGGRTVVGSDGGVLYDIGSDGALYWSYKADSRIESSPALAPGGYRIFGTYLNDLVYSLGPNGALGWSYQCDHSAEGIESSPTVDEEGYIFVGGVDPGALYCFGSRGSLAWSYDVGNGVDTSPALETDGTVYAVNERLYAMTRQGALVWSYYLVDSGDSSPAIGGSGRVYTCTRTGRIYAVESSGVLRWSFALGETERFKSSPAIGDAGRLYIGSDDNRVYCIGPTPTPTPLPNYVELAASPGSVAPGGTATMSWECDFSRWNYQGVPVDIYVAAIKAPGVINGPSSTADALGGGAVYLWGPGMNSIYAYTGSVGEPTYSNIAFPPGPVSGSKQIEVPDNPALAGDWVFATAFVKADGSGFVRTDGTPVENSNVFSIR